MPSISKRKNKQGEVISYVFREYRGTDENGKRLKPFTKTYKPVSTTQKQIEKEIQREAALFSEECRTILSENNTAFKSVKFNDFTKQYLKIKKKALAPTTFYFYNKVINEKINPFFINKELFEIRPYDIQQFIDYIDREDRQLSTTTVKRYLAIIQSIFRQAIKLEIIDNNPAKISKLTLGKSVKQQITVFSDNDIKILLANLESEAKWFKVAVYLSFQTGIRLGELAGLRFDNFNFEKNFLTIKYSVYKLSGQNPALKPTKDYEVRMIPLTDSLKSIIEDYKVSQGNNEFLFVTDKGEIRNPQTIAKKFSYYQKKCGIEPLKFHSIRHTFASYLVDSNVNIQLISSLLGHASIKTTEIYIHTLPGAELSVIPVLNKIISKVQ